MPVDAIDGWQDDHAAAAYAGFCQTHSMYRWSSRQLLDAISCDADATLLDLCAGTGATTAEALAGAGPDARVYAIDNSAAMIRAGRRLLDDPRVHWICAPAEQVGRLGVLHAPADAAVCNSAIWKTDVAAVVDGVADCLRPGGRFAFNIGLGFLGETPPRRPADAGKQLTAAMRRLLRDRHGESEQQETTTRLTADHVKAVLRQAGFRDIRTWTAVYEGPVAEKVAWLGLPMFARPADGPLSFEQKSALLVDAAASIESGSYFIDWRVFSATRS